MRIASGDVNGKNYNGTSLGRGFSVQVVREGTGYALAGTETSMDAVRPGTTWDVRIEIGDRGEQMRLYIDGALVATAMRHRTSRAGPSLYPAIRRLA